MLTRSEAQAAMEVARAETLVERINNFAKCIEDAAKKGQSCIWYPIASFEFRKPWFKPYEFTGDAAVLRDRALKHGFSVSFTREIVSFMGEDAPRMVVSWGTL